MFDIYVCFFFFFFKQKTAYEMRISDWSSDVCSSDLSFQRVREHLAARYTVATYDRRGFSRSQLDGQQDYDRRLETDANDVRRLIEHSSDKPAILFGSSSGGIIVLEVLARHPSVVRSLVPPEPAALRLLHDGPKRLAFFFAATAIASCR